MIQNPSNIFLDYRNFIYFTAKSTIITFKKDIPYYFDFARGKYGIWAGVNIAHASDSPETAANEIALWAKEGDLVESDNARTAAEAYIAKHIASGTDFTMQIRDVVKNAIANLDSSDSVLKTLIDLFGRDAEGISKDDTVALAKAVHDFIVEEIEKKQNENEVAHDATQLLNDPELGLSSCLTTFLVSSTPLGVPWLHTPLE